MPRAENLGDLITADHKVLRILPLNDNSLEFGKIVKIYHGIIEPQHLIDPRQMVLLREQCAGLRKEPQQYCYNEDWMKSDGLILWNAFCYLRNV